MDALEVGKEHRQYVRIQVIGKHGVGKTTLVRKLLEDKQTEKVSSTDGIEIHQKCKIKQDGTWIICDAELERDKIKERILHTVWKDQTQEGEQADSNERGHTFESESTQNMRGQSRYEDFESMPSQPDEMKPTISIEDFTETNDPIVTAPIVDNESKSIQNCSGASNNNLVYKELHEAETERISPDTSNLRKLDKIDKTKPERMNEDLNLKMTEAIVKNMDAFLSYVKNKKDKMKSDGMVECGIWDYAGQRDYYATHQTFLTSKAIYLLVVDITDGITTFQDDMDFSFESIGRYIDFWLDSIHFHRDIQDNTAEALRPPVIMVCTGIDKVGETEIKEYRKSFDTAFGKHNATHHIRGEIHFISNLNSPKKDFEELKTHISDIAKEMHFFEESLPTKWIELETALMVLKELKEEKMEYCETWESIVKIAKTASIEKNELIDFLNYQHRIGNILFFENQSKYIILKPNWLVDCFRCLVCDEAKRNNCTKIELTQLTREGKITEHVIDKLFGKAFGPEFANMKPYILSVMEKFDIIVKHESANTYYIPCMVTSSSTIEQIKQENKVQGEQCTPWLVFEFKFLPIAHYNHIIANYIKAYSKNGTLDLYAGKIIINLEDNNYRLLIVCFSRNAISLQIWKRNTVDDGTYRSIIEELYNEIEMLAKKLVHKLDYIIKAKCSDGNCFDKENRISYDDLTTKCEGGQYYCKEHSMDHKSKNLEETWLKHVPAIENEMKEKKKKRDEDEKEANKKQKRDLENQQTLDSSPSYEEVQTKKSSHMEDDAIRDSLTSHLSDERYKFKSGIAVVINNMSCKESEEDAVSLSEIFEELGFDSCLLSNVTTPDLLEIINGIKDDKEKLKNADCLIFALLTYGNDDYVDMTDAGMRTIQLMQFFSAINCPELLLKPKIFIIQACPGSCEHGFAPNSKGWTMKTCADELDFLLVCSPSKGYGSFGHTNDGASFVRFLCEELKKMTKLDKFCKVLTKVNLRVSRCREKSFFFSRLTKELYLKQ
ncbi:uncharacterized protein LOC143074944 [Mytilus galloprovincialis]|uniref:uncharacterized protein LOC143074944 n=1 Tax=Mytilus galloprovincialis TaxID=29158 RepID=UPI003F7CA7A4